MKKLIIILAAAAMTGCGIYKPYTRPEVKTDGLYGTADAHPPGAGEQYRPAIGAMEDQGSRGDA